MSATSSTPTPLLISSQTSSLPKCSLNVLPCHINHTGPVDASARHWQPTTDEGDNNTAISYFRGRKLCGRKVIVPEGYQGVILKKTDRTSISKPDIETGEDADELEDEKVEMNVVEKVAGFDCITVWNHEVMPDQLEDSHVRGVAEWIKFAGAIHDFDDE